jgi:DNA-binding NarL/FixJ family response regulator
MTAQSRVALVADDDEFFRIAVSSILLSRLKMDRVIETASLDQALDRLGEDPAISLALFDLAMPGMESPASLAAVRELFPEIPVVVVSGSQRRDDILLALQVGVHGYIPKGLGVEELTNALNSILNGRLYVPQSLADRQRPRGELPVSRTCEPGPVQEPKLSVLTPRQRDVLDLLVQGRSNKEIARLLDLGEGTVKIHLAALFRNLGVRNRAAAAVAGAQLLGSRSAHMTHH